MGKNIFEDAYFGKPYKTRDGRKAIYKDTFLEKVLKLMHLYNSTS